MSLSDCSKCWDTPCECGYEYRDWTLERLMKFQRVIQGVIDIKAKERKKL